MIRKLRGAAVVFLVAFSLAGCITASQVIEYFQDNIPSWCAKGAGYYRSFQLSTATIRYSQRDLDNVAKCAKTLNVTCSKPLNTTAETVAALASLRTTVACIRDAGRK